MNKDLIWHKVLDNKEELQENRVMTVSAGHTQICLTHYKGSYNAITNKCPHQGGPLGEGSIENGLLRCPWHGWDYDPCSGKVPGPCTNGLNWILTRMFCYWNRSSRVSSKIPK